MLKENQNMCEGRALKNIRYQVKCPHIQYSQKTKFIYIIIKYFNTYNDTKLFDVKPMQ